MTHFLQRTALIALATTALTACSTTDTSGGLRPSYPIRPPEAQPAPAPAPATTPPPIPKIDALPPPPAAAPVQSKPLEPLPQATAPVAHPTPPAPMSIPRPAPKPVFETVTKKSVTGKVVEVEGKPVSYTVKKGDTLEKIAKKLGTTIDDLKHDNKLKKSAIRPGQELTGPTSSAKAYVVGQGDTLYSIARRFGVTADSLRDENDLSKASLHNGQKLRLPDGYKDKGPITTTTRVQVNGATTADEDEAPVSPPPATLKRTASRGRPAPVQAQPDEPAAPEPAAPSYRTVTNRSVTGKVVEVEGKPVSYTVKKGDNLEKIAKKLDTSVDDLKGDNKLKKSAIHPGQVLKGPRTSAKAYVAGSGDTLGDIAKRFGVSAEDLRAENGLSRRASIRPGQKIRLPDGYRDHGAIVSKTRVAVAPPQPSLDEPQAPPPQTEPADRFPSPPAATLPSAPRPYTPTPRPYTPPPVSRSYAPPPSTGSTPGAVAGVGSAPPPSDAQISELGSGRFLWPVQGQIVSDFGPKSGGQRNDGINIAAQAGQSVRAAAAGDVVYAGDQVPGFGNLVLIKHPDGWVTAYGHLSRVDVKMQQKVAQGQQIGQAGATGGVSEPQLHFEVRYAPSPLERARPIDPKLVLPK